MMTLSSDDLLSHVIGIGGHVLCLITIAVWLVRRASPLVLLMKVVVFVALFTLTPASAVIDWTRGVFGDLSAASLVPLAVILGSVLIPSFKTDGKQLRAILKTATLIAIPLYATSLFLRSPDIYSGGFHPPGLFGLITGHMVVALIAIRTKLYLFAAWPIVSLLLFASGQFESRNLWDAAVDLPAAIAGAIAWVITLVKRTGTSSSQSANS